MGIYRNRANVLTNNNILQSISDFIPARHVPTSVPQKFLSESHFQQCIQAYKRRCGACSHQSRILKVPHTLHRPM